MYARGCVCAQQKCSSLYMCFDIQCNVLMELRVECVLHVRCVRTVYCFIQASIDNFWIVLVYLCRQGVFVVCVLCCTDMCSEWLRLSTN